MARKKSHRLINPHDYGIQTDPSIAQLGESILRTPTTPVSFPLTKDAQKLVQTLLRKVLETDGVGIAANQLRARERICVIASRPSKRYPYAPKMDPLVMINPKIIKKSSEFETDWEGCLSIPNIRGNVPRHAAVTVLFTTQTGEHVQKEYSGFVARIVQHEMDHLHGILFIDRTRPTELVSYAEFKKRTASRKREK